VLFAAVYLVLEKRNIFAVLLLASCIVLVLVSAQFAFMVWIPSMFLIEDDTATDMGDWPVVCSAEDAWMSPVAMPYRSAGEPLIGALVIQTSKGSYGLMSIPGCNVAPLPLPQPTLQPGGRVDFMVGVDYVVPGLAVLFNKLETRTGGQTWNITRTNTGELISVDVPANTGKVLSEDGEWIGWIQQKQIVVRDVAGSEPEIRIDLNELGSGSYVLANISLIRDEVAVFRNDELLVLGTNGEIRFTIKKPADVSYLPNTFQVLNGGWVGWDGYRDQEPYRVAWSLPAGEGRHQALKGRLINSVAVSPQGDLIAVSVSTALNIGDIQDAVYVLRISDGREVFRRYLPAYTRSQVLFPDGDSFLYSSQGKTFLLRVMRDR
jgi:hypothetical protein